jgi:hypothetical protein
MPNASKANAPRRKVTTNMTPAKSRPTKKPVVTAPVGRPTKKTFALVTELLEVIELGFTFEEAADYVGVCRDTIQAWRTEDPEFAVAVKRARLKMQITTLRTMEAMARTGKGAWQMLAWKLERMVPEKFARKFQPVPLVDEEKKGAAPGFVFRVAIQYPDGTVNELKKGSTNT